MSTMRVNKTTTKAKHVLPPLNVDKSLYFDLSKKRCDLRAAAATAATADLSSWLRVLLLLPYTPAHAPQVDIGGNLCRRRPCWACGGSVCRWHSWLPLQVPAQLQWIHRGRLLEDVPRRALCAVCPGSWCLQRHRDALRRAVRAVRLRGILRRQGLRVLLTVDQSVRSLRRAGESLSPSALPPPRTQPPLSPLDPPPPPSLRPSQELCGWADTKGGAQLPLTNWTIVSFAAGAPPDAPFDEVAKACARADFISVMSPPHDQPVR
jgi:hypothetical protein